MANQTTTTPAQQQQPTLRLELFGGPLLWKDRQTVRISPLQTGLLALAFSDGATRIPRAAMQRLLWDGRDDKVLRHRLSQLVYQTNQTAGTRIFEPDGEHICIHRESVSCDMDDYPTMVRSGDFKEACDVLERGFLSACNHRKTAAFADWIEEQRIVKRSSLRRTALTTWEEAEAAHDWSRAGRAAEVLLRLDPREETILRRVMRARVMAGQVREAEAIYWAFAERVGPSGKWNPEPATRILLNNVKDVRQHGTRGSDAATAPSIDPPFVGRAAELAELTRSLFQRPSGGGWKTITVRGEAGVGKTRLVREALKSARFRGYRVMEASAAPLERNIALSPLLDPLGDPWVLPFLRTVGEPWRASMLTLVPELREGSKRPTDAPLPHARGLSRHVCEAFRRLFSAIAGGQKTIFVIDAFHWTDRASVAVLQFLRRRWEAGDFTLLVTYCEEELHAGASVARFIHEEELQPDTKTVHLRQLDDAAAVKLARSVASADSVDSRLAVLARAAGGNPRFVIDLAANVNGDAAQNESHTEVPVPASVHRLMTRRLERLNDTARKVVCALAVIGHGTSLDRLRAIVESTREECLDALDTLHRLRLVEWTPQGVGFRHAVFGHAVYRQIHPSRRTVLHVRTAKVLHRVSRGPALLEVARHYQLAGEHRNASTSAHEATRGADARDVPNLLGVLKSAHELSEGRQRGLIAARIARACHDLRRLEPALRFGTEALEGPACLPPAESIDVRLVLADTRHLLGIDDTDESLAQLQELEETAHTATDEIRLARVLDTRAQLLDRARRHDAVAAELARLRAMEPPLATAARSRTLATLALQTEHGDGEAGLRAGREAFELASAGGLPREAALAGQRYIAALTTCGLLATPHGWDTMRAARAAAIEAGLLGRHVMLLLGLAEWHVATGHLDVAATTLGEAGELAREMDCPHVGTLLHLVRGQLAVARSDVEEGGAVLRALRGIATEEGDASPPPVPAKLVAPLAALEGALLMELGKIKRVGQVAQRHPVPESLDVAPLGLILFHARLRARTGDLVAAKALLATGLEASESRRPLVWVRLSLELVRLARRTGAPQPDLARRARRRAEELALGGLANEFLPFCAR